MQNALLIAIIVGIFNVVIGSYIGPTSTGAMASGFTGFNSKLIIINILTGHSFIITEIQ